MTNTVIQKINTTTSNEHPFQRLNYLGDRCFTIDDQDCKSHDDAICVTANKKGWRLAVHISDVSDSVELGSEYDLKAIDRSLKKNRTSLFSKTLSNETFSLLPGVERKTISFIFYIDKAGKVYNSMINKGIICSRINGVYKEIDAIINADYNACISKELSEKYESVEDEFQEMKKLYLILRSKRTGKSISKLEEKISSRYIVEEFMILTNIEVAKYLVRNDLPALFRVASETSKASYQVSFMGHSSISLEGFSQCTSPIRRISDLKIHQILTLHLSGYSSKDIHKRFDKHLTWLCRETASRDLANSLSA